MPRSSVTRRLATVLFLDIVGSTALAAELGDARWRELLTRFRRLVRTELKRFGGREQDTAGDGFFATFTEPAQALRAAAEIATGVQQLGIDVRTGIHTGECEEIDGKLGGIAVHVGARVMSLAGPAQVLVTGTVTDLVSGAGASFEDRGTHELKGIEGARHVFALTAIERRLPQPLTPEEAAERLSGLVPSRISRRMRVVALAAGVLVLAVAAAAGVFALRGGGGASAAEPIDLLRLNPQTRQVASIVHGSPLSSGVYEDLWARDGTLWQLAGRDNGRLVARDMRTGAPGTTIQLGADACGCKIAFGFGSVWLAKSHTRTQGPHSGETYWTVDRISPVSGRRLNTYTIPRAEVSTIASGNDAVWVLASDGTLLRIDPRSNRISGRWDTHAIETAMLVPLGGYEWICECIVDRVRRFDARTGTARTYKIPTEAFLVGAFGKKLWLLDPEHATLTPMDPETGKTDTPLGLAGNPEQGVVAYGAAWLAEGRHVERFDLASNRRQLIQMPARVYAGGIAADPATHSLWVSNSGHPPPPPGP